MIVNTSDFLAAVGICIGFIAGLYTLTIVPLEKELGKVRLTTELSVIAAQRTSINTETLEKQDIRIEQNRKQIQLGEINSAKREVQMEHLTDAIKELNVFLQGMNYNEPTRHK